MFYRQHLLSAEFTQFKLQCGACLGFPPLLNVNIREYAYVNMYFILVSYIQLDSKMQLQYYKMR